MKLNGWQRFWIVAAAEWVLPVVATNYGSWPRTTGDIWDYEVCARMKPENARWLVNCYDPEDETAARWPIHYPGSKKDDLLDRLVAEDAVKIAAENATKSPNTPGLSGEWRNALNTVNMMTLLAAEDDVEKNGPSADIDGREEKFLKGASRQDMEQAATDFIASLRHVLALKRAAFVGKTIADWLVPTVAFYLLGLAVGWIRRGFGANRFGRAG